MATRRPASQEGYQSSSPSTDHADPFTQQRYYDNDSEPEYGRRDTYYASDSSNPALNDNSYYDHPYDSYGLQSWISACPIPDSRS